MPGEEEKKGLDAATIALICAGAVLLYILSIGPVIKVCEVCNVQYDSPAVKVLEVVYAPLIFMSEKCRPVQGFFMWYIEDVWGVR